VTGRVVLVGGGPGDPDLITVRGLDRLLAADVVITDRLAPTSLLERLGPDVEVIDAARAPGMRTLSYDEIVEVMIDRARSGQTVVRLKGGDPFVLAHGAQEVESCTAAGIPVEVVPGLTSATAGPALAGVALTSTGGAAGFTVVSGHLAPDDPANRLDWAAIARAGTTVVVLMGMKHLAAIAARLIADGVAAGTPATCIADASLPSQRVVRSALADLASDAERAGLGNPAVVIVEAGGRQRSGRRVLVLGGSRSGKSRFAERLLAGPEPVEYLATAEARPDDTEWTERIRRHRERRPPTWRTVETVAVADHLAAAGPAVLVDSVTSWLARVMDECGYWDDEPSEVAAKSLAAQVERLCEAWPATARTAVLVSDEVGSGIVPATASGRRFRDELGRLNQRLAAAADEVYLVTAGIAQRLR
jgi:uroporphyrin-III C-methyltransferase